MQECIFPCLVGKNIAEQSGEYCYIPVLILAENARTHASPFVKYSLSSHLHTRYFNTESNICFTKCILESKRRNCLTAQAENPRRLSCSNAEKDAY